MIRRPAAPPPEHVLTAFGAPAGAARTPEPLAGGEGQTWRSGEIVLKPVTDPAEASWLAGVFESIQISGVRVARPVRSSDGRWVVAGWAAHRFVSGRPAPRHEQIMQVCGVVQQALQDLPEPRFLRDRDTRFSWADRLAWGEIDDGDGRLGSGPGARWFAELVGGRHRVDLPSQVVHADVYGNVLFAGTAPPAVIDITPYWRPAPYPSALVAIDALTWGGAPIELLERGAGLPNWQQLLRRALLFRLALALAHPLTGPDELVPLLSTAERIAPALD